VLANPADAEDVTQTTFLNAYRAYQRGQRPERPGNWLIVIAQNVCRQRFRQAARRPGVVSLDDDNADSGLVEDEPHTLDEVPIALSLLAFNQRTALVMREVHGYSYAESGQALDLSQSAVETLLFRARRALREQLENTLTCSEAEHAISRQLDRRLDHRDKVRLRAHLRACPDCATLARRLRAQRASLKVLGAVSLPPSLATFFSSNAAVVGGGVATKAAAVGAATLLIGGGGYEAVQHGIPHRSPHPRPDTVTRGRPSAAPTVSTSVATAFQTMTARHAPAVVALIRSHRPKAQTSRARSSRRRRPRRSPFQRTSRLRSR
jgi:RNA polymerase sigma-70 factor (ECF subfamily)